MRWMPLTAMVLAAALVAGCGKKEDSSSSSGSSSSTAQKTPEEAYKAFKAAGEVGDTKALWSGFSKKTKAKMAETFKKQIEEINKRGDEEWEEAAKDLKRPAAELKKMTPEEFSEVVMAKRFSDPSEMEKAKKSSMDKVEMRGDIAIVFTTKSDGRKDMGALVKEDGTWKIDVDETEKLRAEKDKLNAPK